MFSLTFSLGGPFISWGSVQGVFFSSIAVVCLRVRRTRHSLPLFATTTHPFLRLKFLNQRVQDKIVIWGSYDAYPVVRDSWFVIGSSLFEPLLVLEFLVLLPFQTRWHRLPSGRRTLVLRPRMIPMTPRVRQSRGCHLC